MRFVLTNDAATVVHDGKTYLVRKGSPNFAVLSAALLAGEDADAAAVTALTAQGSVRAWHLRFSMADGAVRFDDKPVPESFGRRVLAMVGAGEDPRPLLRFYGLLSRNPSWRSQQQLFDFLAHENLPIEEDGRFLAYKGVRRDYMDKYSGKFCNRPGSAHEMSRGEISDDPDVACHVGFHVGALSYAREYANGAGERVVVCRVDPSDVVCVPRDCSARKMRVCRYSVVGHFGDPLPSTVMPATALALCDESRTARYQGYAKMTATALMRVDAADLRDYLHDYCFVVGALSRSQIELVALAVSLR